MTSKKNLRCRREGGISVNWVSRNFLTIERIVKCTMNNDTKFQLYNCLLFKQNGNLIKKIRGKCLTPENSFSFCFFCSLTCWDSRIAVLVMGSLLFAFIFWNWKKSKYRFYFVRSPVQFILEFDSTRLWNDIHSYLNTKQWLKSYSCIYDSLIQRSSH